MVSIKEKVRHKIVLGMDQGREMSASVSMFLEAIYTSQGSVSTIFLTEGHRNATLRVL